MEEKTSKFIGASVSLDANASADIRLRTERPAKLIALSFVSTGRCKITKLEQLEKEVYLSGVIEPGNLQNRRQMYYLEQPWDWNKGVDLVITLTDISGATNIVTVLVETIPV